MRFSRVIGQIVGLGAALRRRGHDVTLMTSAYFGVSRNTNAAAQFIVESRQPGGVFTPLFECTSNQSGILIPLNPHIIIPKNSDVRVRGSVGANSTGMRAWFNGHLAIVD